MMDGWGEEYKARSIFAAPNRSAHLCSKILILSNLGIVSKGNQPHPP